MWPSRKAKPSPLNCSADDRRRCQADDVARLWIRTLRPDEAEHVARWVCGAPFDL